MCDGHYPLGMSLERGPNMRQAVDHRAQRWLGLPTFTWNLFNPSHFFFQQLLSLYAVACGRN